MKKHEYIIENLTDSEINKLQESDIEWYPDDLATSNVCIYGTLMDVHEVMRIIGRE